MPSILVKHPVQDFARWKTVFDEHAGTRKAAGCQGGRLFRDAEKSNDVTIVFHWDSLENAKGFLESQDLRSTMEKAGVLSLPEVYFLDDEGPFAT
jgi:quinol monooxygenase YgiN